MRAPLPRSARSGDKREDARQERRPATGREKNQGGEEPARTSPCSTAAVMNHPRCARARASRGRRPSRCARRFLAPHGTTEEKTRDRNDDRRQKSRAHFTSAPRGSRTPRAERADARGALAPRESRAVRSAHASVSSRPSRSVDTASEPASVLFLQCSATGFPAGIVLSPLPCLLPYWFGGTVYQCGTQRKIP